MKTTTLALAAALVALALPARAAVTVYTTQASFLSQLGARGTDSFNDLVADTVVNPTVFTSTGNHFTRTAGSFEYRLNVGTWYTLFNNRDASNPADVRLSPENAARALNFNTFGQPVFGLGANFFITDVWGADTTGKSIKLTVTDINNAVTNLTLTNTTASTYRGFVSTVALKSLSVIAEKPIEDNWATVNNFTLGSTAPVPEPGSGLLAALGLAGLLLWRRRAAAPAGQR
jgi:MYXO-CTERM domain-containing protein